MIWKAWIAARMTKIRVFALGGYEFDWLLFRRYPFKVVGTNRHRAIAFGFGYIGWQPKSQFLV